MQMYEDKNKFDKWLAMKTKLQLKCMGNKFVNKHLPFSAMLLQEYC